MDLSETWLFWPFRRFCTNLSLRDLWTELQGQAGLVQVGDKACKRVQKCVDMMGRVG